jgi:hypothetical protein
MGMTDFTEKEYAAAIPKCCSYQTMQQHMDMMLCWGLAASLRNGEPMDCSGCELNTEQFPVGGEQPKAP